MESGLLESRQTLPPFDDNYYYTIHAKVYPKRFLTSGINRPGDINVTEEGLSSGNWQFYFQGGRFFIRNYDYLSPWQLGIDINDRSVPRMMRSSGSLGQQWTLTRQGDDGWLWTNGLLGNESYLALSELNTVPGMQTSKENALWDIQVNPSAERPKDGGMFTDVPNFEVATTSTSSSMSSTSLTSASTSPTQSLGNPNDNNPGGKSANGISTPAIAGIAIGGVGFIVICAALVFFLCRGRRRKGEDKGKGKGKRPVVPEKVDNEYYRHEAPARVELSSEATLAEMEASREPVELLPSPVKGRQ
ncbi:hypothetical protein BU24DRAFT_36572 [Aaosphaeria arxii CBS 175.79]|uniref:Mid2 domain-containing protein n=1 Tax=Aaosphaeria arxii CBS 175.79 TaxID=1450172 RepID=A0A6A5YBS0_9PLEO|nr:uncharacterized protein BU24DRAFT_36572 [Aaosphaeria arxii CBS 175.79]KAF2022054.1 hypothetical protein BU24DRAFT_36572 [Aaosphaeria arxii CBS 175.79]